MGEIGGFLKLHRVGFDKRDPHARVHDYKQYFRVQPEEVLREQGGRCMDCGIPFCHEGCPLGNLIPDWNDLVYNDRWQEALTHLHATNNFPEFTGRVCPAPCEASCVLNINNEPVTIKNVERHIADRSWEEGHVVPKPATIETGRRVAVIGSGPAGLAAAQELARRGRITRGAAKATWSRRCAMGKLRGFLEIQRQKPSSQPAPGPWAGRRPRPRRPCRRLPTARPARACSRAGRP